MKKLFVLLIAPLAIFSALQAQTTQQQADAIALERMDAETRPYGLYSKEGLQPAGTTIETSNGEVIELDYESWIYYVLYTDNPQERYLIVKEDNGNLLEVNVKDDEAPDGLEEWRCLISYPIEIPFEEYSLAGTFCQWKLRPNSHDFCDKLTIINNIVEFNNNITCTQGSYPPDIDYSEKTLLLANGYSQGYPVGITKIAFLKNSANNYTLNITVWSGILGTVLEWHSPILIPKISNESTVTLEVQHIR